MDREFEKDARAIKSDKDIKDLLVKISIEVDRESVGEVNNKLRKLENEIENVESDLTSLESDVNDINSCDCDHYDACGSDVLESIKELKEQFKHLKLDSNFFF